MAKKKAAAKSRKKAEKEWEQIGLVTIDTGSLLLIDPCHAGDFCKPMSLEYGEVVLDDDKRTAVITSTGWGDGQYLVEGRYQKDTGRLAEIRVVFLNEEGSPEWYEPA